MKRTFLLLLLPVILGLFSFCSKKNSSSGDGGPGDPPPVKPNTVSGIVLDASGNPVAGARIRAENPTGDNIHLTATSGADGKYSLQLTSIGGWKIYAWKEVELGDNIYQVRLGMENQTDYDAFTPTKGVLRNFVWKLSGRIPDRTVSKENGTGYFGGTIKFINYNSLVDEMPPGTEVTIHLTPAEGAVYLDGSSAAGKTVIKTFTIVSGVGQAYYINDIPATKYVIRVTSKLNGTEMTSYISGGNPDEFFEGFEYTFQPEPGSSGSYESGLGSPNEYPFYILHTAQ